VGVHARGADRSRTSAGQGEVTRDQSLLWRGMLAFDAMVRV